MSNKKTSLICALITWFLCQIIIFLDLKNLGNKSSGGGFIPYGFMIKFNIFLALMAILITLTVLKRKYYTNLKVKYNFILSIIIALITYFINLFLFK